MHGCPERIKRAEPEVNVASAYVALQSEFMVFLTLYTALTIVGSYMVEKHARMMHAEVNRASWASGLFVDTGILDNTTS